MNLSRAYSPAYDEELSVGHVQTPTLAMVVEREFALRRFVPEDYLEVVADFRPSGGPSTGREKEGCYQGTWFGARQAEGGDNESLQLAMRLPADGQEANRIVERARRGQACIESIKAETQRLAPPLLYDLTELQRHANRLYGFSAQKTLDLGQALYENTNSSAIRARTADTSRRRWRGACPTSLRTSKGLIGSILRPAGGSALWDDGLSTTPR
jgi:DNA topoisomerase III